MNRRRRPPSRPDGSTDGTRGSLYPFLDLHGRTEAEAIFATRNWLEERQGTSDLTVRIITGRGLHSVGLPVLPSAIEGLLHSAPGTLVRTYEREPGGGAFLVRLVAPIVARRGRGTTAPTRDPALVLEAQEALADLGIQSTPVLLEAEMQRIIAERVRKTE